ncbi:MAG: UDP-N-acetylmuramoyl-L-alanyl-D-glutamate--2,6-diaminopimelate ligase [Clostridiales bacterium]|jgi:UDP-N-acetylmuramoyl-L-alanyl-D-glutamate--2,6-diaminopimelate ligase|nr:UDP-N-acetylmuramoyl-L-alanyl-D-glutamate--2,6-diaminopimelate ligase [Clostridiales bacterium]
MHKLLGNYPFMGKTGELPASITGFTAHTGRVKPGYLYICIHGEQEDGHNFAKDAVRKGAFIVVAERPVILPVPVLYVADTRHFISYFSDRYYGKPSSKLRITGITGTNGKTTTAHFLHQIYRTAGIKAALMGTVGLKVRERYSKQSLTTPVAEELHKTLWQLERRGVEAVAMEVSSHALHQKRVEHCRFSAAVFTNLTREHLDYHGNMDQYFQTKTHLFELLTGDREAVAVINSDDRRAEALKNSVKQKLITYGLFRQADIKAAEIVSLTSGGSFVRMKSPYGELSFVVRLHGIYNVSNALGAAAAALAQGVEPRDVAAGIEALHHVPGRLEQLPSPPGVRVFLDYAHTPDGLEKVLQAVNEYPHRRIIHVFGCRGNRDKGKRPQMGKVAEKLADNVILTSDNPANEDPCQIAADIAREMETKPSVIPDREQAVRYALQIACPGDIVLITGKGRENYQIIGNIATPYSDIQSVSNSLQPRDGS